MASLVADLRKVCPLRPLTLPEALRVAELQANKLLAKLGIHDPPVPETVVSEFPRVHVKRVSPIPVSGSAHWSKGRWIILINSAEPGVRQRFSLAHELKHVIDAPVISLLYKRDQASRGHATAEQAADYFAACLLMPRMWVKRAYRTGPQDLTALAQVFAVSQIAMNVRLQAIGLTEPTRRCPGGIP